ncbi:hypothetical protein NIES4075_31380 [Tolypothrix sp. NIES-4075]|uniref:hypothetical protein n=1 Tax=Tolypothrix sp. NIES-4075 TaxID=2005459 RepID=UPI000B5CFF98|nr:hypothetical protein [Tolypothrix sp. NIES-4075]GAX42138.1 hypothetical protein NIES4075_31380 [Tolypothrix sp. NIES-4075]
MQILKSENKKSSILPLFAVATFGLHLLTLLVLFFHWSMLQQLQRRLTPQSLVQLADGHAITVDPKLNLERDPQTIRRFVGETMTLMLTWSQQQQPKTVWEVSSELIANELQPKLESEISPTENLSKGTENVLVIQSISPPEKIEDGKWKVQMFANQIIFTNSDRLGKSVSFNKQILVKAIDEQAASLPNSPLPLNLAAYRLGEARLKIYNICEIQDKKCS